MIHDWSDSDLEIQLARQRSITGWDPRREPRSVMISVGAEPEPGAALCLAFAGLGARRLLVHHTVSGTRRAALWRHLEQWLDDVTISHRELPGATPVLIVMESLAIDAYVDATGRCAAGLAAAASLNVPAWSVAVNRHRLWMVRGAALPERVGATRPAAVEACVALAGLLGNDFVLGRIVRLPERRAQRGLTRLDLGNPWHIGSPFRSSLRPLPRPLHILMCGAGGLGCPAALALGAMLPAGSRVVVADPDHVEPSNRNRQFLYTARDAEQLAMKAPTLCRRMQALRRDVQWIPVPRAMPHPDADLWRPFDAVFTLTDSLKSRSEIDEARLAPIVVNAASSLHGGSAALFHAGTPTLTQALGLAALEESTSVRRRAACGAAPASIITTNFLGAALAVALLRRHVMVGPEPARTVAYDPWSQRRGGAWPPFAREAAPASALAHTSGR